MTLRDEIHTLQYQTLNQLIPLSSITSPQQLKALQAQGIQVEFTTDSFKEQFPFIEVSHVYYSPQWFGAYLYLDLEHFCLFDLQLMNQKSLAEQLSGKPFATLFPGLLASQHQLFEQRDYAQLLLRCPENLRPELLQYIATHAEADEELYTFVINWYQSCDYAAGSMTPKTWERLFEHKSSALRAKTEKALSHLPDEVTVYRGEGELSTPTHRAVSWTLNPHIAHLFACGTRRQERQQATLIQGKVKKEDILESLLQDGEEELIILPGRVQIEKRQELGLD